MDWFHCNMCHMRQETTFNITSCGHVVCKNCVIQDCCSVCKTVCKYLPISDNLTPQEKMYFKSLKQNALKYFHNITQAWRFQKQQYEHHVTFLKKYITTAQKAFQEARRKIENQENELKAIKKENDELRSMVNSLKSSLSRSQSSSRRSSSSEAPQTVRSHSGSSTSTSSGVQERTTPISPNQSSPLTGQSTSYWTDSSSDQLQTPVETSTYFRTNAAVARDPFTTPNNNTDRLRALQLKLPPKMSTLGLRR